MKRFLKDSYQLIIFTTMFIVIGITILLITTKFSLITEKKVVEDNYTFTYDSTWSIKSKKKNQVLLKHKKGPVLRIVISDISEEYRYDNLSSSIDNILYSIEKDNSNIKLINKQQTKINNNDSYKVLYENKKQSKETLLTIIKISNKLIVCDFSSNTKYFDLLLDSQNDIISTFKLNHKKQDLDNTININTTSIKWINNKDLSKDINDSQEDTISNMNYTVNYKIPNIFIINELNTTNSHYTYRYNKSKIELKTNIKNINIYEYLNSSKDKYTLYYNYKYLKDKKNYKEYLSKKDNTYIYKNSYESNENAEIIYPLDNNHIFIINISIMNGTIPIELINNIKLIKYNKYSSNINKIVKNNKLISYLKILSTDKQKENRIKIVLPTSYNELDKGNNMYRIRYFNKKTINLKYDIINNIERSIESIKSNYSVYSNYGKITLKKKSNYKDYILYEGSYYKKNNKVYTNILYRQIDNSYIKIEVEDTKSIEKDLLNEITNISNEIKKYKGE